MTLDEAIKHAEERAEDLRKEGIIKQNRNNTDESVLADRCIKCAKEHRQLAEWLKELKQLKEQKDGDLIVEIDKLPRIKVGNSNSPTVKYCIDEVLIYDLLEHYKKNEEE